jgi:protein phosphatase
MLTHVGLVRGHNEDTVAWLIPGAGEDRSRRGMIALVADGMGGHAAGEVASALAAKTITEVFYRTAGTIPEALAVAFAAANRAIRDHGARVPACRGMGTTCTALVVQDGGATLAHIGDSRAYLLRDSVLRQISTDHSLVARMRRDGLITAEEMAVHPNRNVILRSLGKQEKCEPEIWPEPLALREGDRLVLCSDGLSDLVREPALAAIVAANAPAAACAALCQAALAAGGHANVSVGVFAVVAASGRRARPVSLIQPVRQSNLGVAGS